MVNKQNINAHSETVSEKINNLKNAFNKDKLEKISDNLSFLELADIVYQLNYGISTQKDEAFKKAVLLEYNNKRLADLLQLQETIPHINHINFATFFKQDLSMKNRIIIHLSHTAPQQLASLFEKINFEYNELAPLFLKYIPNKFLRTFSAIVTKLSHKKVTVDLYDDFYDYYYKKEVYKEIPGKSMKNYSPLLNLLLTVKDRKEVLELIALHHAKSIPALVKGLVELHKISEDHPSICFYAADNIKKALSSVLSLLDTTNSQYSSEKLPELQRAVKSSVSFDTRRLQEKTLVADIEALKTKSAVYAFYRDHGDKPSLSQHRHSYTSGLFPKIKVNTLNALEKRLESLSEETGSEKLEVSDMKSLELQKTQLREMLSAKRVQLNKPSGLSFFQSSELTREKIGKIGIILGQLKNIASTDELRFFVATLMTDKQLIGHRGFGSGLSNTALNLKNFYQEIFIDKKDLSLAKTPSLGSN